MEILSYDFVAIGGGPVGHHGAIQAAKQGAKTALIDRRPRVGGACLHAGTIASKTLREAVIYLAGLRQRQYYGKSLRHHHPRRSALESEEGPLP